MSNDTLDAGVVRGDPVEEALDSLDRLDSTHDPRVLIFDGAPGRPVVAAVGRELHYLSSGLVYARKADVDDIRATWDEHGEPRVIRLSSQSHRFDAQDFREVANLE
jgi:hypothetical protein